MFASRPPQHSMTSTLLGLLKRLSIQTPTGIGWEVLKPSLRRDSPGPSDTFGSSPPGESSKTITSDLPFTADLPLELWLDILDHVTDRSTFAILMRVSRLFCHAAELRLYHTVTLDLDRTIYQFCESITQSPHRAKLVAELNLTFVDGLHGTVLRLLLPILKSLRSLECLTINIFHGWGHDVREERLNLKAVLGIRFPFLRGFATNSPHAAHLLMPAFLREHPFLEELEFGTMHRSSSEFRVEDVVGIRLRCLRAIACHSWFLSDGFLIATTLTHLHATSLKAGELGRLARLLGKRLVSLRISEYVRLPPHLDAMTLNDIAGGFPRLRFLQIDMEHKVKPYISKHPIDCMAARSSLSDTHATATPSPISSTGFTLVLAYTPPAIQVVDMKVAAAWHDFLNKTAFQVLHDWNDCVERIVYRHTIIPFVSVSLSEDGMRLVRKKDTAMRDDRWKHV